MANNEISIGIRASGGEQAAAEAKKAETALEGLKQAAEGAAAAAMSVDPSINPMTDGSQLRAGKQAEEVQKSTRAIEQQVEALEELTEAEAGVIRSTAQLNEEARKPDGFKSLFDQQRLIEIGRELGKLGAAVGDFAREFAKTEKGQEILSGLSEQTKLYGSTAAGVAAGVAQGFATGGPIGAALAGLTALVEKFAGEYLDAQARIEASNAEFEQAAARAAEQLEKKQKAAANKSLEDQIAAETDRLEDQNEVLAENERLLRSRKELADSEFELRQAQDENAGKSRDQLEIERIQRQLRDREGELTAERSRLQEEANLKERAANNADVDARNFARVNGSDSPEAAAARERARKAREEFEDAERSNRGRFEEIENQRQTARNQAVTGITRIATGSRTEAERDSERRAEERRRQQEREEREADRERDQAERQRTAAGRTGEGIADRAARSVSRGNEAAARRLEELGN
jgi:hypothetical protein